jgi:phosphatidate cytidylyltransferase
VLRERVLSAGVLIPILVGALVLGGPWIVAVVAVIAALAALEVFGLLRAAGYPSFRTLGGLLAVAIVLDAAAPPVDASGLLLAGIAVAVIAIGTFALRDPTEGLTTWVMTVFGGVYVGLLGFVLRLAEAGAEPGRAPLPGSFLEPIGAERAWILVLVLAVWSYDTGAYFTGRRFGRRRFLTHLSPSKTYAGLFGGLAASALVTMAMMAGFGQQPLTGLVLGLLLGLAAQAGDLAESMLKRAAGAKDSGRIIPGHGGILDRIDSFLFAAPALTLYVVSVG